MQLYAWKHSNYKYKILTTSPHNGTVWAMAVSVDGSTPESNTPILIRRSELTAVPDKFKVGGRYRNKNHGTTFEVEAVSSEGAVGFTIRTKLPVAVAHSDMANWESR